MQIDLANIHFGLKVNRTDFFLLLIVTSGVQLCFLLVMKLFPKVCKSKSRGF